MKKIIATTVAALTIAGMSFTPVLAAPVHHGAHWGMKEVCKVTMHNHHKVKTCHWVKK